MRLRWLFGRDGVLELEYTGFSFVTGTKPEKPRASLLY